MKYPVILSTGVEQELEEAALWIENERAGFGEKFITAFDETVNHPSRTPFAYAVKYKSCREISIGRFSYILVFKIIDEVVLIVRLMHTSRHPKKRYKQA